MSAAVYRNPRYEERLEHLERQVLELANLVVQQGLMLRALGQRFAYSQDAEAHIPPLPDIRDRPFGMGH